MQTVLDLNWRSASRCPLRELTDALGGSCGRKINISPPLPVRLARGSRQEVYGYTRKMEID